MSDYGVELYGNAIIVSPKFAAEKPEAVRGFLRALCKGVARYDRRSGARPSMTVLKRNELANKDVELERLRMALDQNILTPWVKANGFGGIDRARFEKALDQIGLALTYKNKPKSEDIFDGQFLPPAAERKVN